MEIKLLVMVMSIPLKGSEICSAKQRLIMPTMKVNFAIKHLQKVNHSSVYVCEILSMRSPHGIFLEDGSILKSLLSQWCQHQWLGIAY